MAGALSAGQRRARERDGGEDLRDAWVEALDGCSLGADGPDGRVLSAIASLLHQIDEGTDHDPLRQERTPGFDLALVAATVARTPDAPMVHLG